MNFTLGVFIITSASLFFLLFWLFYATMPFHDFYLSYMDQVLQSIPHPRDSKKLEHHVFFGSRYTDITECTYEVGEIRSSSLAPQEVLRAYNNISTILTGPVHVIMINKDTAPPPLDNPAVNWIVEFRENMIKNDAHTYYLVYLYKPGMSGLGDARCFD